MNITKILFSVMAAIMIVTNTNATTMCVDSDMETIIFDPTTAGTTSSYSQTDKTWSVTFDYGTLSGIATCNDRLPPDGNSAGYYTTAPTYNFDQTYKSSEGGYCWCKIKTPARSAWTYVSNYGRNQDCDWACAQVCAERIETVQTLRRRMFDSLGM